MSLINDNSNGLSQEDLDGRHNRRASDIVENTADDMEESNDEDERKGHAYDGEQHHKKSEQHRHDDDGGDDNDDNDNNHDPNYERRSPRNHRQMGHGARPNSQDRLAEQAETKHSSPSIAKDQISSVSPDKTNIIYATNISPVVTLEQMQTFFGFLGDIINIAMYHFDKTPEADFKVCFVEFAQHSSVLMAKHLTNTIFIDRAIFVLPYNKSKIPPDAETAAQLGFDHSEYVTNFNPGVVTQVTTGPNGAQVLTTSDQRLTAASLQQYPQLPMNTDPTRIEEIRRTLYIGNLDSAMNPEAVLKFFNDMGEVKYIRVAGDENQPTRFAFVEFTHQASVANAILYNGFVLGTRALKINHSNNPIVKPQPKLEIEDPSRKRADGRMSHRDLGSRGDSRHLPSNSDRKRDTSRGYYDRDRRLSPRRHSRSHRSRSRDSEVYSRSRRSRSRDHISRHESSRHESSRRRSRSRDSSKRRRSRSRSAERRSKHKSSSSRRR